jgi:hypothetical protein
MSGSEAIRALTVHIRTVALALGCSATVAVESQSLDPLDSAWNSYKLAWTGICISSSTTPGFDWLLFEVNRS